MKIFFGILILSFITLFFLSSCAPNLRTDFPKRVFIFPKDMAPHRDYNSEWWYQTGYLYTDNSSTPTFGYEFTLFRFYQPSTKRWPKLLFLPMGEIWDVHLAIHDFKTGKKFFVEKLLPPNLLFFPPVSTKNSTLYLKGGNDMKFDFQGDEKNMKLKVSYKDIAINFDISALKNPIPENRGFVSMATAKSYYYSITRLDVKGDLTFDGKTYDVHGQTWYDQQWGDMRDLSPWDWYSLRLNNDEEIMIFRFPKTGETCATYVKKDGTCVYCDNPKITFDSTFIGKNGKSIPIPMPGYIEIPSINAIFTIKAITKDQYNIAKYTPSYWEGLCNVEGKIGNEVNSGYAYFEGWR
jgi:predicted secreted hydrolase